MVFRATRVPASAAPRAGSRDAVRYDVQADWPGISAAHPRDWCDHCTRAYLGGTYQVKRRNVMCSMHQAVSRG